MDAPLICRRSSTSRLSRYTVVTCCAKSSNGTIDWVWFVLQALLDRCAELSISGVDVNCNLDDRVDSGSGWFQMNFVKGTLMHVFAACGHRDLAEMWIQAGGSSVAMDLVGATPAMIAARNGYFSFPGARSAAAAEGLTTEPFGFTLRRKLQVSSDVTLAALRPMDNGGWSDVEADLTKLGMAAEAFFNLERCVSSSRCLYFCRTSTVNLAG